MTSKDELVRLALTGRAGETGRTVLLDPAGRMPGRGAYLCRAGGGGAPAERCLALAVRRGGIARALRSSAQLDLQEFVESVSR